MGRIALKTKKQMRKYKSDWATQDYRRKLKESPEAFKKSRAEKNWIRRHALKDKVFKKLGDRCSNPACQWLNSDGTRGCTDRRCLQIDHVLGDAKKDKEKVSQGTETYYLMIFKDNDNRYQILCSNCNWIKRRVNGEDNARVY
jgi:hypothetical protein